MIGIGPEELAAWYGTDREQRLCIVCGFGTGIGKDAPAFHVACQGEYDTWAMGRAVEEADRIVREHKGGW